jgi:uncharacterized protein (DUF111 family)
MMEQPGCLLLLQIDHLSGEEIGQLIESMYEWGASNVHVLTTGTKKNRLGHLALVDASASDETALGRNLARHFGISGYHRLESVHCHDEVSSQKNPLVVRCKGGQLKMDIPVKVVGNRASPLFVRVQYEGLQEISQQLKKRFGVDASLTSLRLRIDALLATGRNLELELDPESGRIT